MLTLIEPAPQYFPSLISGINEYKQDTATHHISTVRKMIHAYDNGDLNSYLQHINIRKMGLEGNRVPTTTFWLLVDDNYAGSAQIRHRLNEHLYNTAGHISFELLPSKRGKGYALQGIKMVLGYAHTHLFLTRAMMTCSEHNKASYAVMRKLLQDVGGEELPPYVAGQHKEYRAWLTCSPIFP